MKFLITIILLLFLSSCSNWIYKDIQYESCGKLEKIHVHFFYHETSEWSCLEMEEGDYVILDNVKIKYKTNKKGKITKVKLVK
jgi:hypothetical protein